MRVLKTIAYNRAYVLDKPMPGLTEVAEVIKVDIGSCVRWSGSCI